MSSANASTRPVTPLIAVNRPFSKNAMPRRVRHPDSAARVLVERLGHVILQPIPAAIHRDLPLFQRFRPFSVASQTLPSFAIRTDCTAAFERPCFVEIVETARSRKRSSPSRVATQRLPSRSSKIR